MGTVAELIFSVANEHPSRDALVGVEGERWNYGKLAEQTQALAGMLRSAGVNPSDPVAVVMPDGPALAMTFLAVASCAACAPLNPAYKQNDFRFYLEDLQPKALVLLDRCESAVIPVARELNIPILHLAQGDNGAGFQLRDADGVLQAAEPASATPEDVALILHTSGTTSRPKMVPLTNLNLCCSAANVASTLQLSEKDRCLNVMPLFHIHGLIGGLLSSISAGATIISAPGFKADRFLDWASTQAATWYTAVPTMHQAVLNQAELEPEMAGRCHFRLIRSSSAALPPSTLERMEARWKAPVIESYGMTEAAHQMASNPLPPQPHKPGSVGIAAGPEVGIMDEAGNLLPQGERGEIVIKGPNVTTGYAHNPEANAKSFTNGWFRTGDQGYFDEDGYLFLSGRLKEMINRGGENIAPREIDEVLLQHDAIAQAVAFAIPHETLGEDLAAAVVLRPEHRASEKELRQFVSNQLADFKVPSRIVFVDTIPKGPTGKLQRIGLHEKLADVLKVSYVAPETESQRWVADAFSEVLRRDRVGRDDNFFYLGGDSIRAIQVLARISARSGIELPVTRLFENPTPQLLGAEIDRALQDDAQLDTLARELEGLSPEELERLLSEAGEEA